MRIWISGLIVSLCMSFYGNLGIIPETETEKVAVPVESQLYAKAAALIDAESGRVLYEKNGEQILPMASTTKIMTCILVLEHADLKEEVTVSSKAASMPDVQLNIREGEKYYVEDLLYSLMLESHNDSAMALAEHVGKSKEGFAALMNEKAKELGCKETYFITPNGLDASLVLSNGTEKTHSTTAVELARIMKYCIMESPKKAEFLKITRTSSYSFGDRDGKRSFSCSNHNAFLTMMEGALSGKTGFTGNAGYCYVGALERDGKTFIVALLACGWPNNKTYKWSDTKKLMNYGIDNFEYRSFSEENPHDTELEPLTVRNGQPMEYGETAKTALETEKEFEDEKLLLRKDELLEIVYELPKELNAPIEKGQSVGKIKYLVNKELWKETKILAKNKVEEINLAWCLKQAAERYFSFS